MEFLKSIPDNPDTPKYLYKFKSFEYLEHIKDILCKNKLYFSLPSEFKDNDLFDCKFFNIIIKTESDRKEWIESEIKAKHPEKNRSERRRILKLNMSKFKQSSMNFYKERQETLNKIIKNRYDRTNTRILCFSRTYENVEMWKKYIPNGEGVSIKFNTIKLYKYLIDTKTHNSSAVNSFVQLRPVEYFDEPLQFTLTEYRNAIASDSGTTFLYSKDKGKYCFENEWRFVMNECISANVFFPPDLIEEVILSNGINKSQTDLIHKWNSIRSKPFTINTYNF